ncbi:MAG: flagellar basal-body rod protein FlgF [Selenomonas sp.]|jgi:flagellar basal-body rod protein FlgG|nr:flagellar basal-body rod protein FlgF [Selenomonas sp.]MCI7330566.1 flagellar basal-body rod protein FlgF [Selenomonadaceae bacterium]MDD6120067.1 flagellar basal-body rod protein FlgF [Selenomonadaceae bacterium]MDD7056535.1 flagellar basal-body rod protein FlgF [Selenomonadaceae bacterium]MDY3915442.1 flagellar basal-body rod protein FlgF [Selenomonadaceae bacterium]
MWRGLYTAGAGMITETKRTDVIANNLANVNTTGFKRDEAINAEFRPMLLRRINDNKVDPMDVTSFKGFHLGLQAPVVGTLGLGSYIDEVAVDQSQGMMETTGNPLDLAIAGNGWFAVQTPQGVRYTRDGAFFRGANGQLQTVQGLAVLGANGQPIVLPANATQISVGAKGEVRADNQVIGQLQFVEFDADRRALLKQGNNLWYPQAGAQPRPATGEIQQGMLERSNANVVNEMVSLINNYRIYEAGSKAVTTQDSLLDKAANQVGKV